MYENGTRVLSCWYGAQEDMFLLTEIYCNIRAGDCGVTSSGCVPDWGLIGVCKSLLLRIALIKELNLCVC